MLTYLYTLYIRNAWLNPVRILILQITWDLIFLGGSIFSLGGKKIWLD